AAQRPPLRVVKGAGTGRRRPPEAAPPPPAASETALAAGTDTSVMTPLPDSLDPLGPIRNTTRSEAFVASLVALEETGLIPPGTALEQYQLPGVVLRADRPGERVALSLQPGRAEAERVLYRVEAVENGVLRLRRTGGELDPSQNAELHVGPSHELIPFQANDYVFLRAAGPERPRPSRGPETPPPPGGDDANLPARHAIHPELLEGAGRPFSIPPARLPDLDYAARRAELELNVVNEGPHAWVEATLPVIEAVADDIAARSGGLFPEYGPLAESIRADLAVMRDPAASLESLEPATRRLAELLRLRREFPPTDPALDNLFRDNVAALYARGLPPPSGDRSRRTARPPRPDAGAVSRPATAEGRRGGAEGAPPTTETTVRVVPEMPRDDTPLLAEIEAMAAREVEGFSDLARRTREALLRHDGRKTVPADDTAMRTWREGRQRILEGYRRERLRLARELVARHETPGRRVLEFLQGLSHDEGLWGELEAVGVERARVAADIPPHGRPKAVEDVLPKVERRGWNSLLPFTDLFGTRIVVESYPDALAALAAIRHRFRVRPEYSREGRLIFPSHRRVRRSDGTERVHLNLLENNRPVLDQERVGRVLDGRRSGYRALHVVVEVDGLPVEIQIQTRSLYRWGHIQHEFYKNETLARPENRDLREAVDRYFAEAARYLAQTEQGVPAERPAPPELPADRLAVLPRESRSEIRVAVERMEALLDERPAAVAPPPTYRRAVSSLEVRTGRGVTEHPLDGDWAAAFFPEGHAPTELAVEFALDADVDADQAAALWQSDFSDTLTRRLREGLGPRAASREPVAFRLRLRRDNAVTEIFMVAEPRLLTEEGAMRRLLTGESFAEADFYHQIEIFHPEGDTEIHLAQVHLAEGLRGRGLYESFSRTLREDLARRHPRARVSAITKSPSLERIFLATYAEAESVPIETRRPEDGLYLSGRLPAARPEEIFIEAETDLAAASERRDAPAEALSETEAPAPTEAPRRSAPPDPFDSGNLHASFLGAGLMMAMTSMGHSPGVSLLAGIFGTVLPVGILGVIRWVRGRLGAAPAAASGVSVAPPPVGPAAEAAFADFTVAAEDGSEFVFRPYRAEPGAAPWRYIASVDRVLPASRPDHFEATFAVVRQAPGEPPGADQRIRPYPARRPSLPRPRSRRGSRRGRRSGGASRRAPRRRDHSPGGRAAPRSGAAAVPSRAPLAAAQRDGRQPGRDRRTFGRHDARPRPTRRGLGAPQPTREFARRRIGLRRHAGHRSQAPGRRGLHGRPGIPRRLRTARLLDDGRRRHGRHGQRRRGRPIECRGLHRGIAALGRHAARLGTGQRGRPRVQPRLPSRSRPRGGDGRGPPVDPRPRPGATRHRGGRRRLLLSQLQRHPAGTSG
ncbi:hypothetical protein FBR05_14855, partial [Deltaproteobacteria bacterium PRO3]|nr:hypothetical protein [Deltaproteobacteria bacterium PRO3]